MDRNTLPRHARAHAPGWAHPYPHGVFSPFFYADGDDTDDDGQDDDQDEGQDDGEQDDDASDDDQGAGGQDDEDDEDPEGADDLGDKGKRALASMKGKWKSEREKRRALEQRLADQDSKDDAEAARRKAEQDATTKANARILRSEVRAAAKGRLADPKDALTFLDLGQFEVNEDGEVDEDEIAEAIEDLIKNKPYLAAAKVPRFQGTGDGGAARKAGRPKQLTEKDLKTMTPEQIVKAQEAGQFDSLLGGS
ncbi:hypothetical protein ACFXOS_19720 [Streptomyces sp. NPDC059175]|uniref:hypothetical protein n=1 Tax=Streptomyces sp. NPDC059175 TaxID=3346757 RepID=UPI0036C0B82F